MRESVSANLFTLFGVACWLAAAIALYLEETAGAGLQVNGLDGIAAAVRVVRHQDALLELACCGAIVGTLFIGFAAVVRWQVEAINAAEARTVS